MLTDVRIFERCRTNLHVKWFGILVMYKIVMYFKRKNNGLFTLDILALFSKIKTYALAYTRFCYYIVSEYTEQMVKLIIYDTSWLYIN